MNPPHHPTNWWRLLFGLGCAVIFTAAAGAQAGRQVHIALAGDSTVATFAPEHPERGWGQMLGDCFDQQVAVENFAQPGRSTKTFLDEGRWANVIRSRPDYILIQFGHNDSHAPDHREHTDPDGLYTEILRRFIKEAKEAGAIPILVTPVQRRTTRDGLLPYVAAMKKVATETHTLLIDLHRRSGEVYARIGAGAQAQLGATSTDTTHFNAAGAKRMAELVATDLGQAVPALGAHLRQGLDR
jgi:lysophospholipase L1-like esterase